jgi:hypothetical protein
MASFSVAVARDFRTDSETTIGKNHPKSFQFSDKCSSISIEVKEDDVAGSWPPNQSVVGFGSPVTALMGRTSSISVTKSGSQVLPVKHRRADGNIELG